MDPAVLPTSTRGMNSAPPNASSSSVTLLQKHIAEGIPIARSDPRNETSSIAVKEEDDLASVISGISLVQRVPPPLQADTVRKTWEEFGHEIYKQLCDRPLREWVDTTATAGLLVHTLRTYKCALVQWMYHVADRCQTTELQLTDGDNEMLIVLLSKQQPPFLNRFQCEYLLHHVIRKLVSEGLLPPQRGPVAPVDVRTIQQFAYTATEREFNCRKCNLKFCDLESARAHISRSCSFFT